MLHSPDDFFEKYAGNMPQHRSITLFNFLSIFLNSGLPFCFTPNTDKTQGTNIRTTNGIMFVVKITKDVMPTNSLKKYHIHCLVHKKTNT